MINPTPAASRPALLLQRARHRRRLSIAANGTDYGVGPRLDAASNSTARVTIRNYGPGRTDASGAIVHPRRATRLYPHRAAVSTIVVGVMLVAAFQTVASAADGRPGIQPAQAQVLADMLPTEVCSMPYRRPQLARRFRPESGETAEPRTFNDIDDYDGYTAKPRPIARASSSPLRGLALERERAERALDLTGVRAASASVGLQLVTVTVTSPEA